MATFAQFTAELDQCRAAMAAENYLAARKYLTTARVTLLGIPDSEKTTGERLQWQREIDGLSKAINQLEKDTSNANSFADSPLLTFQEIHQVEELD